jgi:O-antigen ligase
LREVVKFKVFAYILVIVLLVIFFNIILDSGSRKSAISFFIVISFTIASYLTNNSNKFDFKRIAIIVSIIGFIAFLVTPILIEGTILEERFEQQEDRGGLEGDIRYKMYTFGFQLFMDHPVLGVGFDNYKEYFPTKLYSHSDYIESLTSTGFVGFILYQLPFFMIIFKAITIAGYLTDKKIRFYAIMCFVGVIVIKVIGLGIILYNTSPSAMIIFASLLSFTYYLKKDESLL